MKILIILLLAVSTSSHAQKLVQEVGDAKKLQVQEKKFVGKPLKDLITQIGPTIKFVYGNPENKWSMVTGGTFLKFMFVNKQNYFKMHDKNQKPTGITVEFVIEPNNTHLPLPKEGLTSWGPAETQEYGDMIISHIYVSGSN